MLRPRLFLPLCGALFARGRRTVTSRFRSAEFRPAYFALWAAGCRAEALAHCVFGRALGPLMCQAPGYRLLFGIDETPTLHHGPCV